ncbi:MAG: hypothetical protein V4710_05525, partial [Verrucomicrobiota bacterium]
IGEDAALVPLNSAPIAAGAAQQFDLSDTGFDGQDRRYSVTVTRAANNQVLQSPRRSLWLPRLCITPAPENRIMRGLMNRLDFTVRNDSTRLVKGLRVSVAVGGIKHYSETYDLGAGAESVVPVVVPGYANLASASAAMVSALEVSENQGELVQ